MRLASVSQERPEPQQLHRLPLLKTLYFLADIAPNVPPDGLTWISWTTGAGSEWQLRVFEA